MNTIPIFVSVILLAIAAIHLLWALGVWWPIRDEEKLVGAVAGLKGATKMPGAGVTSLVVLALITAVWWVWFGAGILPEIHIFGLWFIMIVFFIRGILSYLPFWQRMWPQEPFSTLDKKYYGPLCVVIGLCFRIIIRDLS